MATATSRFIRAESALCVVAATALVFQAVIGNTLWPPVGCRIMSSVTSMWRAFWQPVEAEARRTVAEAWRRLDPEFRVAHQTVGRREEGCGATIGAMPRCDFGCTGCYLGRDANGVPPLGVAEVKDQMRVLRRRLGPWGNLQLTDGEVLLRPLDDVVELLQYARRIGLVPMLMTHGDHLRRRPGLLEHLVVHGGLVELSIHIDSTQRGRQGYLDARCETDLMPLRDEFAGMIRAARARTGRPLRVASTVTVTRDNLPEVGTVVAWFVRNADAFRIVSFQPAAAVGRTRPEVAGGVGMDELWRGIAKGVGFASDNQWWFGHPQCSRLITGLVAERPGESNRYTVVGFGGGPIDHRFLDGFLANWGGISFRAEGRALNLARVLGMACRHPGFALGVAPRFAWSLVRRLDPQRPARLAFRLLTGRARVHSLTIGSHHFMSAQEMATPQGQQRLANCIFTVPVDGELVSMCEVNATDLRRRFYDRVSRDPTGVPVEVTVGAS